MSAEISDETPKPRHPAIIDNPVFAAHEIRQRINHCLVAATTVYVHSEQPFDPAATSALADLIHAAAEHARVGVEISRNNRDRERSNG